MVAIKEKEPPRIGDKAWEKEERVRCAADPFYFAKYVKVKEPPPGRGIISFSLAPHVKNLIHIFMTKDKIVAGKSRQVWWSWTVDFWVEWKSLFTPGFVTLMTSQGETEAAELLGKLNFIHEQLPDFLRLSKGAKGATKTTYPAMMSEIYALPSTESAGIGKTASLVVADEWDFHPFAEQNFALIKPTIDAGGQVIGGSSKDPNKIDTFFRQLLREAATGKSPFYPVFLPWHVVPSRDKAWLDRVIAETPDRKGMPKQLYKECNYPDTLEEFLSPPKTIAVFDHDRLREMEEFCRKPKRRIGPINVFEEWVTGHHYGAFTDAAHGIGQDESVTVVMDCDTGHVVCDVVANNIKADEFTYHSVEALKLYKYPVWGIEDNDPGPVVISKAEELDYPDLFDRHWQKTGERDQNHRDQPGWHTDAGERSRIILWNEGVTAIDAGQWLIYNRDGLKDFYNIARRPDKNNKIMALSGAHDDYPLTVCGAWQMRKYCKSTRHAHVAPINTIQPRTARGWC